MRLCRLDLVRYGRFTGGKLDFGAAVAGTPDLHIVYGPNEAGKSTALNAWIDLLFGIEAQSSYAFLHPYGTMRIGARLETGGRSLTLSRIKGNKATLLDEGDRPLPDATLLGPLGGLDRRGLREMFSLDDETLEAGGNSILDSEGEVGQLLFASGAGLAGFAPALAGLRKAPDPFFSPPSRKGELADLKAELSALDDERRRLDTDATGYKRLMAACDAAQSAYDQAQAARVVPMAALQATQRRLAALPGLRALEAAEARLAAMPDLPPPPEGWSEALVALERDRAAGTARLGALVETLQGLRAERAVLTPDPVVLSLRQRIEAAGRLRSAHDEGVKDLAARRSEASRLAAEISAAVERLGRPGEDPAQVLPGRAAVAGVRALIEARSGKSGALVRANEELARAGADADRARADLAGDGDGTGNDVAALAHLLRRLQDEAPAAALARATEAQDAARAVVDQRLRALGPWRGSAEDLAGLTLPGADVVAGWATRLAALDRERAMAGADLQRLDAALSGAVPAADPGGVTLDAAAEARALREAAWAAHRVALDSATAAAFEAAMRRDDAIAARLAETLAETRRHAEAMLARAATQHERGLAAERLAAVEAVKTDLQAAMATALAACGLPPLAPEALEAWSARRLLAIEAWDRLTGADRDAARAHAAVAEAQLAMGAMLKSAGVEVAPGGGLAVMMARAQALCDTAVARAARHQVWRQAEAQLALRKAARAAAESAWADWERDWSAALGAANLPPGQSVESARDDLATLEALTADHRAAVDLADRIAKMESNVAAYEGAVAGLADALGMAADTAARLGDAITARLLAADQTAARIAALDAKIAQAALDEKAGRQALSGIEERIAEMVAGSGAADAADLARRLAMGAARAQIENEVRRAADALCLALDLPTVEAARAALAGLDRDAVEADARRLDDEVTAHGAVAQAAFAALSEARRQLDTVGGDDAVLRLAERRETILLQIAEGARDHLARRLGLIGVEHALRRYRERHRSVMIEAASEAFRQMTRGAYAGLATQPDGTREVLVAQAAGGASKRAADLSKGTRFQLYLALRVAAYRERAAQGPVPPFVADDIMETFDDDRSAETFAVLADMARVGQVIYLTHHRHLCEIARSVCPGVRLHRLE